MVALIKGVAGLKEAFDWLSELPEGTELIVSLKNENCFQEEYVKDLGNVKTLLEETVSDGEAIAAVECCLGGGVFAIEITSSVSDEALPPETTEIELQVTFNTHYSERIDSWVKENVRRKQRFTCLVEGITYYSDADLLPSLIGEVRKSVEDWGDLFEITELTLFEGGGIFVGADTGDSWELLPLAVEEDPSLDKHGNFCGLAGLDSPVLEAAEGWEVVSEWEGEARRELDLAIKELLKPYGVSAKDWQPSYYWGRCETYEAFLADNPEFAEVSSLLGQYPHAGKHHFALFVKRDSLAEFKKSYLDWVLEKAIAGA